MRTASTFVLLAIIAQPTSPTLGQATESFNVEVRVATSKPLHPISPFIYGASAVAPAKAKELGLTTTRWGGNRTSRYNWKTQADNAGSDWYFLNGKSGRWSDFVEGNRKNGLASYLTVPMLDWVAKGPDGSGFSVAKYGPQKKVEPYVADRGDGLRPDGKPVEANDPRDTSVASTPSFQGEGIRALKIRADATLPRLYGLDNEPMLWSHTHRDVHPNPLGYDEILQKAKDLALAIKSADPKGLVAGPCTWGWTDLQYSALDEGNDRYASHFDRKAHGDQPFLSWYLGAMKRASASAGKRLLDVVDVHFYPQGQADGQPVFGGKTTSDAMRGLRIRSTRSLWDRSYKDESWIGTPVALIPLVRGWVDLQNQGTKICVGEYSWGGDDDPSGAIAQAEILGIFAREKVDYAYFWAGLGGVQKYAFQLYRNPEGKGPGFGSTYLDARSTRPETLSSYASRREDGAITLILINKDLKKTGRVKLTLDRPESKVSAIYRLPNPPGPIRRDAAIKGGTTPTAIELPPLTAALLVFPAR